MNSPYGHALGFIMRRSRGALIGFMLLSFLLVACGDGKQAGDPSDQPSSPASSPTAVPEMSVPFVLDLRTGAATPLAEGVPTDGRAYAVSPDRTMVATNPCCHPPVPVWLANMDGSDVRVITPEGADGFSPRWSPDGSKLVFQERDAATEELGKLVVYDLTTGKRTPVTDLKARSSDQGWFVSPSFAADGRSILFGLPTGPRSAPEPWDLWSVPVEGGQPMLVLRGASGGAYSPDGRSLAYADSSGRLIVADADGANPRVLSESVGFPRWSPDGTRIVQLADDGVYVIDVGTGETSLVARGDWPEWFDDNTLIIAPQ